MQLTRKDIENAMMNEAFARCRYELFAEQARAEGLYYFAKILEETAKNELSHFREFMHVLGDLKDTKTNLATAIAAENEESEKLYPALQQNAMADGELNTARLFQQIAKIEERHKMRLQKLAEILQTDSAFKRDVAIKWKCRTCGYVHEGKTPPNKCPGCQSSKAFYEPEDFSI